MIRVKHARPFSLALFVAFAACSSGGGGADIKTGGQFVVLSTEPNDNGTLFLNDSIRIDFSHPVDLASINVASFAIGVKDLLGNQLNEPVAGSFLLSASPGDTASGRRLEFVPRLPTNDLFSNGGFRPGRVYDVSLVAGTNVNVTVLHDQGGRPLAQPKSFRFTTANGTTPVQLFRNIAAGGPRRAAFEITPSPDATGVVLNKLGTQPVELRLRFDQPLNPSSANVPVAIPTSALSRSTNNRGRIFLEYDDPVLLGSVWIPAEVELEANEVTGATVLLRPIGVLPNNAVVRVIVEPTLEDISGESNVSNAAYVRVFATFRTKRSYEQQFDALVEEFTSTKAIDLAAPFAEPVAQVGPGYIKAGFAFEGSTTGSDFEPTVPTTILNTNFTQVTPSNGPAYNVSGGVFNFRNVRIPATRKVIGQGSNPMVWLVSGSFEVAGTLSVRGGDGQLVSTAATANTAKAGGTGVCGGGNGGAGSPSTIARDAAGATGNGPLQAPGQGGVGGSLACTAGCGRGAGGGGGGLATQGDPNFKLKTQAAGSLPPPNTNVFPIFQQQTGVGGNGCIGNSGTVTRNLQGSVPGPLAFSDPRSDNNFWGVGVRFDGTPLRITGELQVPVGGGGGGGGGDLSFSTCNTGDPNFDNDSSGGGGGGGGGVLIVKALGPIIIADGGNINADGGSGGGGEPSGSCTRGGGGGAGAGGMVILMSATRIDINARGTGAGASARYLYGGTAPDTNDFAFSISADGGACVTGSAFAPIVTRKYQADGTGAIPTTWGQQVYDLAPLGGFGGMGVVELMAPPGATNADGTNTRLDENINFYRGGILQSGASKRNLLAWRGFPNQLGQGVDDSGAVITIGDNEGDIRPSPILLPVPFAAVSRLRSNWIDTGSSSRRPLAGDDNLPRGIIEQAAAGVLAGPRYEFEGVYPAGTILGFARYAVSGGSAVVDHPVAVQAVAIQASSTNATFLGQPAYRVELAQPALGTIVDRFVHYEALLLDAAATPVGSFRILSHTDRELFLEPGGGAFPATAGLLQVRAKFFDVVTNGQPGLGPTYAGSTPAPTPIGTIPTSGPLGRVPDANVRIGFAFHQNPASATAQRFPAAAGTYVYNLADPVVQEQIRALHAPFVQWDIQFDMAFKAAPTDTPPPLAPDSPRPELHFLRLPYRF